MLGLTIGIGRGWAKCAHRAARRMEAMTGVRCFTVTDWPPSGPLVHPSWLKLWLPDLYLGQDLLIFDADLYACRPWSPAKLLKGHDFAWVRNRNRQAVDECEVRRLDPDRYATSGLLIVRAGCSVLREARRYYPEHGPWYEEVGLNEVAQRGKYRVNLLPERYNMLHYLGDSLADSMRQNPVNLHLVGLHGSLRRLIPAEKEIASCNWKA